MIFQKPISYYLKYLPFFSALAISFWIPMYRWILSYFIGAWIFFMILLNAFASKKQYIESKKRRLFLLIQLLFFGLIVISYFFSANKDRTSIEIVQKLSLFLFPILFYFSSDLHKIHKNLFLKVFVISVIFVSFLDLFIAFYNSVEIIGNEMFFNASVLKKYGFVESITHGGNYFFYIHLSFFHHPAYFSMYIVFSVAILFYFKDSSIWFKRFKYKILYFSLIIFLLLMVFLLSSRAGILSAILLIAFRIIIVSYRNKKYFLIFGYVIVFAVSIFYVSKHERVKSAIDDVKFLLHENVSQTKPPSRIGLWKTAIKVIGENYLFGAGIGDIKKVFSEEYEKSDFSEPDKIGYNAHNQFMETFMTLGVSGVLLLLLLFITAFIRALKKKQLLFLVFLSLTFFNFLFESMFNTIAGIVFFFFFFNYFIFIYKNGEKVSQAIS